MIQRQRWRGEQLTAGFLAGFGIGSRDGDGDSRAFRASIKKYVLINGGYLTVALTAMGAILGARR